ncbi:MAG: hypothetical protein KGD59_14545 [Candidatus Heimdallarchaeota archaeon]|jgi:hypothetical protein|nr:hypothetical protein [Candidatus Heimdallarchaeota archaeon]MBY8995767.1 hypothetical protein [Candidatus Heimdallarchaeota archaeon]
MAFEDWAWILILVIEILLITLVLYLSMRLITGRKKLDASYFFRLFFVAIILAVGVSAIAYAISAVTNQFASAPMFYVFLTIGFIIVIRYLLTTPAVIPYRDHSTDKYWQWSIWMTIISLLIIFIIEFLVRMISGGSIDLIPHF